jgi:hypothetical protein
VRILNGFLRFWFFEKFENFLSKFSPHYPGQDCLCTSRSLPPSFSVGRDVCRTRSLQDTSSVSLDICQIVCGRRGSSENGWGTDRKQGEKYDTDRVRRRRGESQEMGSRARVRQRQSQAWTGWYTYRIKQKPVKHRPSHAETLLTRDGVKARPVESHRVKQIPVEAQTEYGWDCVKKTIAGSMSGKV